MNKFSERLPCDEKEQIRGVICVRRLTEFRVCRFTTAAVFILSLPLFSITSSATELKQSTVDAFEHYVRATDARMDAEVRPGGPFLWIDPLPQPRRQHLYDLLQRGDLEIRQEKTEDEGKPIEVPDGLIHHWTGLAFVPGVSLEHALSLLQDYDNHCRTYKPDVRRSKLLEHTDNTFKIYLQFYKDSPRRVSFNTEFEVHYTRIDATHAISRAISARIAELEHPEQPDSPELPVGQGRGYLWRVNNYWRLEEKNGGVYMQVESIALSRDVPAVFAWFVNPLIRRTSRQTLAHLLEATRRALLSSGTGGTMRFSTSQSRPTSSVCDLFRDDGAQNRTEQSLRKLPPLRFYCCCAKTICGSGLPELSFVSVSSV